MYAYKYFTAPIWNGETSYLRTEDEAIFSNWFTKKNRLFCHVLK